MHLLPSSLQVMRFKLLHGEGKNPNWKLEKQQVMLSSQWQDVRTGEIMQPTATDTFDATQHLLHWSIAGTQAATWGMDQVPHDVYSQDGYEKAEHPCPEKHDPPTGCDCDCHYDATWNCEFCDADLEENTRWRRHAPPPPWSMTQHCCAAHACDTAATQTLCNCSNGMCKRHWRAPVLSML